MRAGRVVAGMDTDTAGWLSPYFNRAWGQVVTPWPANGASSPAEVTGRPARRPRRAHEDDADAEVLGQRQYPRLDLALVGVVGHLDRADPPGPHDLLELVEGRGLPMGGGHDVQLTAVTTGLELVEAGRPGDQVVHLEHLDVPPEEPERGVDLALGLGVVRGPHLRRDDRLRPPGAQRRAEDPLCVAVHGRGVDERGARVECGVRHALPCVVDGADVEGPRRPHADDRHVTPGERSMFHGADATREGSARSAGRGGAERVAFDQPPSRLDQLDDVHGADGQLPPGHEALESVPRHLGLRFRHRPSVDERDVGPVLDREPMRRIFVSSARALCRPRTVPSGSSTCR